MSDTGIVGLGVVGRGLVRGFPSSGNGVLGFTPEKLLTIDMLVLEF